MDHLDGLKLPLCSLPLLAPSPRRPPHDSPAPPTSRLFPSRLPSRALSRLYHLSKLRHLQKPTEELPAHPPSRNPHASTFFPLVPYLACARTCRSCPTPPRCDFPPLLPSSFATPPVLPSSLLRLAAVQRAARSPSRPVLPSPLSSLPCRLAGLLLAAVGITRSYPEPGRRRVTGERRREAGDVALGSGRTCY